MDLFDLIEIGPQMVANDTWRPEAPPCLDGINEIYLNFETSGLKWWDNDRPISLSVLAGDRAWYLPWGHRGGGNLNESTVREWAQRELRGKLITNINTRFDIHMSREWGIDLEAQGNQVSDVSHYAALLDDHRLHMNLDSLIQDYLHEIPMKRLDESRMKEYSAGAAAPRSMYNVDAVRRLKEVMWPMLDEQNLQRVRALEDKVIFATVEMEKNGAPIDMELLERWSKELKREVGKLLLKISKEVGFQVNPDSPKDQAKVFNKLKLPITRTAKGGASFTDAILKEIQHPIIKDMRRAGQLMSLDSKYIKNTMKAVGSDGILRYSLHQLRAAKDENSEAGETGTVTGRYSSAAPVPGVGCNIQQRMKAAKQRVKFGYDEDDSSHDDEIYLVRKLHIPSSGKLLSSDMDQAQYRIFASDVNNPKVTKAYQKNPKLSFHHFMHELLREHAKLVYREQKDLNFAVIFGAGLTKMSLMLHHITQAEFNDIRYHKKWNHPGLKRTKEVRKIYNREIPEVQALLDLYMHLAKPECDQYCKRTDKSHRENIPHQGYVETVLGRRMRFPDGNRLHKAYNGRDQGTEADYMKTKLVELHSIRKETGFTMRITNHDEIVGDTNDEACTRRIDEVLNYQSFPELRVPLTWSTETGPNWADTK